MDSRTHRETLSDRLLLLWLLYDAMKFKPLGDTKAQKLTYLSELCMINELEKGFNYDFIKLPYGPYSEELQEDINWIEEQKLIDSIPFCEGKVFKTSRFGTKVLADFSQMFVRNNEFTHKIYSINCNFAKLNTHELVKVVHDQPHPYIKNHKIDDLKIGTKILYGLSSEKVKIEFNITPEELATLEIYFDDESYRSVISACESAKQKPLLTMDEVFG